VLLKQAQARLSDEELEDLGVESNKAIQIKPLAMTFMAVQGEIAMMKQLSETFESQKAYEATFKLSYLNADAHRVVLAYKIGLLMGSAINALRTALPQKHEAAASRSKNLAWALLHQAARNNGQYCNWVEAYGSSLTKDATFREIIGVQMRNKVAPLIKKLCALPVYQACNGFGRRRLRMVETGVLTVSTVVCQGKEQEFHMSLESRHFSGIFGGIPLRRRR